MRISTKGRYAIKLMLDLATNDNGEPIRLKDVARRQEISEKYLEQIISSLNRAGYVKSVRGSQGGYLLKMDPKEYTVGMILRVTEGSLAPVDCAEDGSCDRVSTCATAMLASIGTNRAGKRAAMMHLMFNVIGTILFIPI